MEKVIREFSCPKCQATTEVEISIKPNLGYWGKLEVQCEHGHKTIYPNRGEGFPPMMKAFLG